MQASCHSSHGKKIRAGLLEYVRADLGIGAL